MSETSISILMNDVCNNLPFLGPDKALYSCACDIHPLREVYLIFREVYLKIVIAHGVQILSPLLQIGQISLY